VTYNQRFFADGRLTKEAFNLAQTAADKQFSSLPKEFFDGGWDLVLGSSGSVKAISEALQDGSDNDSITLPRLRALKLRLIDAGDIAQLQFANIERKRIPLLPAGLAILISFFRRLELSQLEPTTGALREGVLGELAKVDLYQNIRQRTLESLAQRFHVDTKHGSKVCDCAMSLFDSVADAWQLRPHARLLTNAAMLHEIGIHINSRAHHKHGWYIISNSDMPGFNQDEQQELALLIGNQHKKPQFDAINALSDGRRQIMVKLICLLRLAVLLNLGRVARSLRLTCQVVDDHTLELIPGPSDRVDLLYKDLKREKKHLGLLGLQLCMAPEPVQDDEDMPAELRSDKVKQ
ncbi:MAG: hypothetical protein ACRC7Q_11475, partial [Plesiomonas shigelloides]